MTTRQIGCRVALAMVVAGLAFGTGAADAGDGPTFNAPLAGANELQPADPDGTGRAKLEIDVTGGEVCFRVQFRDSGTPNRAHIHAGDAATNGPIVVTFFELRENPSDPRHDQLESERQLEGCVPADPALVADIAANPQSYYCNLHNARFPAGQMRGQLAG